MFSAIRSSLTFHRPARADRRGAIVVFAALLIVVFLGVVAFAVDIGYIVSTRTELQAATDSAVLAGAGALVNGTPAAKTEALAFLAKHKIGGKTLGETEATIEFGVWDSNTRKFTVNNTSPNAVRVTANSTQQPLFFGRIFGKTAFDTSTQAVAVYQPRDIALVLDYSGSMCYDSQFRNIGLLGQSAIEANLLRIYQEMGSPKFGTKLTFAPVKYGTTSTSTSNVKKNFGLDKVSYPYPGGSWDDYINYVQDDSYVNSAGYRCKYGYLTWVNYLLAKQCGASDTPGLWKVCEQPVTALKDAVDVFLSYLQSNSTDDRVSFSLYTYSDDTAKLESPLTKVYSAISTLVRQRQAGHYVGGTNISAGMTKARVDLQTNGRPGALKMMVLMTDGVVNMPTGNTTTDKAKVIQEAQLCATAKIPIVTISVGAYADTALMQQVANITGGAAFIVPGGQPIAEVEEQLKEVFAQVAADRPLKLVE